MRQKLNRAALYDRDFVTHVRSACLHLATTLGDFLDDVVIVGGLVPSLLVDQRLMVSNSTRHVGTMDLDIGLAVAILEDERYHALTARIRAAGFTRDTNESGNPTNQRWIMEGRARVAVDFLIAPSGPNDQTLRLRNIEQDFAAIIAPGLELAFVDRELVRLDGETPFGELASRDVWVAGPAAFVILKALAFHNRSANKDAYDLDYVLRHHRPGMGDIVRRLKAHAEHPSVREALTALRNNFAEIDSIGPRRVAEFVEGAPNDEVQADVRGLVADFLDAMA